MEKYVLGKVIGKGGFGCCYLGLDATTSEHVAVKELPVDDQSVETKEKVKKEFNMLTDLRHPHVVGVKGFEIRNRKAYIYMEWMAGGSVEGMLQRFNFRLHESLVRRYTRQALLGLAFLHGRSVIHRDVKPANMLVAMDGTLKLSDFGTSKTIATKSLHSTSIVTGTIPYMSPETIRGHCCPASDVWALGCSVIEMTTGRPPWSDLELEDPLALLFHIGQNIHHPAIPLHLSDSGKNFLEKCFMVDHMQRPTCELLLQHPFLAQETIDDTMEPLATYIQLRNEVPSDPGPQNSSWHEDDLMLVADISTSGFDDSVIQKTNDTSLAKSTPAVSSQSMPAAVARWVPNPDPETQTQAPPLPWTAQLDFSHPSTVVISITPTGADGRVSFILPTSVSDLPQDDDTAPWIGLCDTKGHVVCNGRARYKLSLGRVQTFAWRVTGFTWSAALLPPAGLYKICLWNFLGTEKDIPLASLSVRITLPPWFAHFDFSNRSKLTVTMHAGADGRVTFTLPGIDTTGCDDKTAPWMALCDLRGEIVRDGKAIFRLHASRAQGFKWDAFFVPSPGEYRMSVWPAEAADAKSTALATIQVRVIDEAPTQALVPQRITDDLRPDFWYLTNEREPEHFDTRDNVCSPFVHGDRIKNEGREGTCIGACKVGAEPLLFFHMDGNTGATFFPKGTQLSILANARTALMPCAPPVAKRPPEPVPSTTMSVARDKTVFVTQTPIPTITQESTQDDVIRLLSALTLTKDYSALVRAEGIDGEVLMSVTEEDLVSLGISVFGDRRKIVRAVQGFKKS